MVLPATKSSSESLTSLNGSKSEESVEIKNEIFINYEPQVYPLINSTQVKDEDLFDDFTLLKNVLIPPDYGISGTKEVNKMIEEIDSQSTGEYLQKKCFPRVTVHLYNLINTFIFCSFNAK